MDSLPGSFSGLQLLGRATDDVLGGSGGVCLGGDRRRSLPKGRPDGRSADVIEGILPDVRSRAHRAQFATRATYI
jgi:hypothetical protein